MLNQVILIGRTTRDIELREASNGRPFGIVTVAVNRSFKNQETDTYDTDFVDVSLWGITAQNVAKYAGKGSAISIRGRVANRVVDFPREQTFRTISVVGEQVSFIQTKAPGTPGASGTSGTPRTYGTPGASENNEEDSEEATLDDLLLDDISLDDLPLDDLPLDDFPTDVKFDEEDAEFNEGGDQNG